MASLSSFPQYYRANFRGAAGAESLAKKLFSRSAKSVPAAAAENKVVPAKSQAYLHADRIWGEFRKCVFVLFYLIFLFCCCPRRSFRLGAFHVIPNGLTTENLVGANILSDVCSGHGMDTSSGWFVSHKTDGSWGDTP